MQKNPNLTDDQKKILFEKGTEAPFSDNTLLSFDAGKYSCVNCGATLFDAKNKYESKTPGLIGWPSFDSAIEGAIIEREDNSLGMKRTEVVCAACNGHLGHVFAADDAPSGTHYCINGTILDFKPDK